MIEGSQFNAVAGVRIDDWGALQVYTNTRHRNTVMSCVRNKPLLPETLIRKFLSKWRLFSSMRQK